MKFQTMTLISAGDVSGNLTSASIDTRLAYGLAVQATFTGSPSGTVLIEGSNDGTTWTQIASLTISGTTAQATNQDGLYWPLVRVYKAAGGTGTMTVTMTVKGA